MSMFNDDDDEKIKKIDKVGNQSDDEHYGAILQLTGINDVPTAGDFRKKVTYLLAHPDPCQKVRGKLLETLEWCLAVIAVTSGKGACGAFTPQADDGDGRRASCSSMLASIIMGLSDTIVNLIATQPVRMHETLIKGFQEALDKSYAMHPGIRNIPDMNKVRERVERERTIQGHGFVMNHPGSKEKH